MSKIEVNEIDAQSGTTITVGSACKSVAVPGNIVKTNAVQASDAGNIISQSGTTITIGASGDTVSLASGASQSGFGRSGSVDWQTGSIKTASSFTAASGEGYFVDTSSNAITANLPAGSAGAIVAFSDYARNFGTNKLIITPNGSEKIGGQSANVNLTTNGEALTLVYVDSTKGWINVQFADDTRAGQSFIAATGGTITCSGNFRIHTFTGPGTFCVSAVSSCAPNNEISYLIVAAGAGAAGSGPDFTAAGGGGAGGYREKRASNDSYTSSPKQGGCAMTITANPFPVSVGGGGAGGAGFNQGANGSSSVFNSITATGGGGGASYATPPGQNGGSGGGGGSFPHPNNPGTEGSGNVPNVSPPQGFPGGIGANVPQSSSVAGGGGGGALGAGSSGTSGNGGAGGGGTGTCITASPVTRAGGGGGGGSSAGAAGSGGGAAGKNTSGSPYSGNAGTANTGGGGGGTQSPGSPPGGSNTGGAGGSGIVVIRYKKA